MLPPRYPRLDGRGGVAEQLLASTARDRQDFVSLGVRPSAACFATRSAAIAASIAAATKAAALVGGRRETEVVFLGTPTAASRVIRPGDALWALPSEVATPHNTPALGAPTMEVFSSFAGLGARLPQGYVARVDPAAAAAGRRGRIYRRGEDDPVPDDEEEAVYEAAFAEVYKDLVHVGTAMVHYVVGDVAQDGAGVAALVSGCTARENDANESMLAGTLARWALPVPPKSVNPFDDAVDRACFRARLVPADPQAAAAATLRTTLRDLLVRGGRPTPLLAQPSRPPGGEGGGPPSPLHEGRTDEARKRERAAVVAGDHAALAFLHLLEAAVRFGIAASLGGGTATDGLAWTAVESVPFPADDERSADETRDVNLARAAVARALCGPHALLPAPVQGRLDTLDKAKSGQFAKRRAAARDGFASAAEHFLEHVDALARGGTTWDAAVVGKIVEGAPPGDDLAVLFFP